ncbi:glycosyltransferase [Pedobacter sp. MC2016-14]|uniref:glycosyltransferase n=1 Tax=Pedobacter sp. MC2016-14 TaxID=2897327 RepID=UPI001E393790|nr:glycosyltransferase [Pedobacter sp. MC2016-14]MCD0486939.1 glycosyltransferase [Pedobacter sp. MC2016-14]
MKIAIVHDELMRKGGAEQVVLTMLKAFPDADVYTLAYNPTATYPEFANYNIRTSGFQWVSKSVVWMQRLYFPFGILAMRNMDVKGYDVVLTSTTHCAKYVSVDDESLVVTYCHTPFRLAWRPESYNEVTSSGFIKKMLYKLVVRVLRKVDAVSALRTDYFLTNAQEVVPRIKSAYHPNRRVTVINPPVKCDQFKPVEQDKDYYLVVSRFEPYKKVDLVIEAFNKMPDKKLVVLGKGTMENYLRGIAAPNVSFLTNLDAQEIAALYAGARALVFPQHEDYGITPLEANASGCPVIAYGAGGVLETMIPYRGNASRCTALFFENQDVASLTAAIYEFEGLKFNSKFIRRHAELFDEPVFIEKLKKFIQEKYELSQQVPTRLEPVKQVTLPVAAAFVVPERRIRFGNV